MVCNHIDSYNMPYNDKSLYSLSFMHINYIFVLQFVHFNSILISVKIFNLLLQTTTTQILKLIHKLSLVQ